MIARSSITSLQREIQGGHYPAIAARAILHTVMSSLDIAVSIALGIGLAAAVGFRVFLPLLVTSVAAYTGHLQLSDGFAWLGITPRDD